MTLDLLITGGFVIDGTGSPASKLDVGIKDEHIISVSRHINEDAETKINAKGLIVAPGFIDPHSHTDLTLLAHPSAERALRQGITTEVVGNCGLSPAPLNENNREYWKNYMGFLSQTNSSKISADWDSFSNFLDSVSQIKIGTNLAFLVGHNALRSYTMGLEGKGGERAVPTKEEMDDMREVLNSAMIGGAFGLSTGLTYPPGRNCLTDEIIELCKILANYNGIYASHIRGGLAGLNEFFQIIKISNIKGLGSHQRGRMVSYPGSSIGLSSNELVHNFKKAIQDHCVLMDVIPIPSGLNSLVSILFGGWGIRDFSEIFLINGDLQDINIFIKKITDPKNHEKIKNKILSSKFNNNPDHDTTFIQYSKNHPEYIGKILLEIAENLDLSLIDFILKLVIEDEGDTRWGTHCIEEDLEVLLSEPYSIPCSDGYSVPYNLPSATMGAITGPRIFGSIPYFIQHYVMEKQLISIEEAVHKMTLQQAKFFDIKKRGVIKENNYADIVIFNPKEVRYDINYEKYFNRPYGINYMIINGKIALCDCEEINCNGKIILHKNNR